MCPLPSCAAGLLATRAEAHACMEQYRKTQPARPSAEARLWQGALASYMLVRKWCVEFCMCARPSAEARHWQGALASYIVVLKWHVEFFMCARPIAEVRHWQGALASYTVVRKWYVEFFMCARPGAEARYWHGCCGRCCTFFLCVVVNVVCVVTVCCGECCVHGQCCVHGYCDEGALYGDLYAWSIEAMTRHAERSICLAKWSIYKACGEIYMLGQVKQWKGT